VITTIMFHRDGVLHDITLTEDPTKFYRYNAKCNCGAFTAVQNSLDLMSYEIDKHKANYEQRAARV
jgi:hypothetical protein